MAGKLLTKRNIGAAVFLFTGIVLLFAYQVYRLRIAHSSFENYYAFRGCVQLIEKTDTRARCALADGQEITIVKVNNKWFLEGDYGW